MGIDLIAILGGLLALIGGLFVAFQKGKKSERNRQAAEYLEAVEKANEVDRNVDAEPDPVKRLRDNWQR